MNRQLCGSAIENADAIKDATQTTPSERPSVIIVEVLGFGGDGSDAPADPNESRRRGGPDEQRSQDLDSPYQILGAGQMTADEARQIIAERRRGSGQR